MKFLRNIMFVVPLLFVTVFAYGNIIIQYPPHPDFPLPDNSTAAVIVDPLYFGNPDRLFTFIGNYNVGPGGVLSYSGNQIASFSNAHFLNNVSGSFGGAVYIKGDSNSRAISLYFNAKVRDAVFSGNKAQNGAIDNDIYMDKYSHLVLDTHENRKIIMYGGIMGKKRDLTESFYSSTIEKIGAGTFVLGGNVDYDGTIDIKKGALNFIADEGFIARGVLLRPDAALSMENGKINKIFVGDMIIGGNIVLEVNLDTLLADTIEARKIDFIYSNSAVITIEKSGKLFLKDIAVNKTMDELVSLSSEIKIGLIRAESKIDGMFKESYYENILMSSMSIYGYGLVYDNTDKWLYLVIDGSKIVDGNNNGTPEQGTGSGSYDSSPDAALSFTGAYNAGPGGALSSSTGFQGMLIGNAIFLDNVSKSSGGAVYVKRYDSIRFNAKVRDAVFSGNKAFDGAIDNDIYMDNFSRLILEPYEGKKIIMYGGIVSEKINIPYISSDSIHASASVIEKIGAGTFVLGGHVDYDGAIDVQKGVFNFIADEGFIRNIDTKKDSILSMENAKINKISVGKIVVYGDIVLEVNLDNLLADTIEASKINSSSDGTITIKNTSKLFIKDISTQTDIQELVETNSETKIGLMKAKSGISGMFEESFYEDRLMSMSQYGYGIVYDTTDNWLYLVINGSKIDASPRYEVINSTAIASLERFNLSSLRTVALLGEISNNPEIYGYSPEMDELFGAINNFLVDYYPELEPSNSFGNSRSRGFSGATAQPLAPGLAADKIDETFAKLQGRSLTNMLIMGALESEGKISSLYSKINNDNKKVWGQVYFDGIKFDSKDSIVGEFKSGGYGINAGIDLIESESITGGLYADYGKNKIEQGVDSADMQDIQIGLYGGWFKELINVKANISGGMQKFSSVRDITIGKTYKKEPVADFDTYSIRFGSEAEYTIQIGRDINIKPFVGLHGGYVMNDDIKEAKGAGTSLLIKSDSYLKLVGVFGAGIGNNLNSLTWNLKAYAGYTLVGDKPEYEVSFANSPAAGNVSDGGTQQADLVGGATLGFGYTITETVTIYTDLSADFGNDLFGYFATAGVKYKIGK